MLILLPAMVLAHTSGAQRCRRMLCEMQRGPWCSLHSGAQDVKMVAWRPDGELLASASYDDTIKLWKDVGDEWECTQTLSGGLRGMFQLK